jgi:TonB family protein
MKITKRPSILKKVEAAYTDAALKARIGEKSPVKVVLNITIDATGKISEATVISGPGYGLNKSALAAIKQFEFSPAEINGKPASVSLPFTMSFSMPILPSAFKGTVVGKGSGAGLKGTRVEIEYSGKEYPDAPKASSLTKADGSFSFENVPPGVYTVKISPAGGFASFSTTITMIAGKESGATYTLDALPENIKDEHRQTLSRSCLFKTSR